MGHLDTLKEKLRKGEYLDDVIKKLREGDQIHVYNAYDHNGEFLGKEGEIEEAHPESATYEMGAYDRDFDEWRYAVFSREEIELLEGANPHYIEEMKRASWWPAVAEERAKFLAEQDRSEADRTEGQNSE